MVVQTQPHQGQLPASHQHPHAHCTPPPAVVNAAQIPRPEVDPEAYQKALARTRQAQCVQRAIGYMRANEPSRWVG